MAPAKTLTLSGVTMIAASVLVGAAIFAGRFGAAPAVLARLDILALIAGIILVVTGLFITDVRRLHWENARAAIRKAAQSASGKRPL